MTRGRSESTTKVFVGSLPAGVTTEDLRKLFEPYGAIAECDIANRCGFLHLEDQDLALKAIEDLNGIDFMGAKISVEKGRVKPRRSGGGGGGGGPRGGRGGGPMRGGRGDRGGPYSRDSDFRGGSRGGFGGGRDAPFSRGGGDRFGGGGGGYDRAPRGGYGDDRRGGSMGGYDDRRAGGGYPPADRYGGYDRRPYDDRPSPGGYDAPRGGFEDRRSGGYDDRRSSIGDRRSLLDSQGPPARGGPSSYERPGVEDLFSRREGAGAMHKMTSYVDRYGGGGSNGFGTPSGAYPDSAIGGGGYGSDRGGAYGGASGGSYGGSGGGGGYGDSYGSAGGRGGGSSYDSSYPPLPQQRGGFASGGPGARRDVAPGRRY